MTTALVPPARSQWLVGPSFDLALFFGGAALAAAVAALTLTGLAPIVVVWWIWLLCFDGPHMMATYSRTYFDAEFMRERRALLFGSLLALVVGPAIVVLSQLAGHPEVFFMFLGLATLYAYHHVVRQHYGFVALYKTRAGERSRAGFLIDKWAIYLGLWSPYVYFMMTHHRARALLGLEGAPSPVLSLALIGIFALAVVAVVFTFLRLSRGERSAPKLAYALVVLGLTGAAYFAIGRFEPVYARSTGPDEDYLLLSIMISLVHGLQYIALVFVHNRSRYGEGKGAGPARWLSRSWLHYLGACALFSALYLGVASATGVFPVIRSLVGVELGNVSVNRLALAAWWGLALHHYVVDQKIWRFKDDPALRSHLGIA